MQPFGSPPYVGLSLLVFIAKSLEDFSMHIHISRHFAGSKMLTILSTEVRASKDEDHHHCRSFHSRTKRSARGCLQC